MTIRLSTGARNAMMGDGTNKGLAAALAAGFINIYTGTQPATADTGATGTLLGTVTKNNDGSTGITVGPAAAGVLSQASGNTPWQFGGLAAGVAGWYRYWPAGGNPAANSSTEARVDGLIGTAGADLNFTNTTIAVSAVTTIDSYTLTLPTS